MAVAQGPATATLAEVLDLISQVFHRDGVFLEIARANRVATGFLERQREVWRRPDCDTAAGGRDPACVLPALNTALEPTGFAPEVVAFERWVEERTGIALSLSMLKTVPAWSLFLAGVVNSLVLVAGALAATLLLAPPIGAALAARAWALRLPAQGLVLVMQSSPVVLTLVIAAAVAQAAFGYSSATAIGAAVLALGLTNGSYAGQAIAEAVRSLRAEAAAAAPGAPGAERHLLGRAVGRSATQVMSFLINAAKGTPVASFIGAPELLSTLTDITSFASGRATTYTLLLVFYVLVVVAVVRLCARLRRWIERRQAALDAAAA
jgi:ABC-type amino acid transport system permease subunit